MGTATTFDQYAARKETLLAAADRIEAIWRRATVIGADAARVVGDDEAGSRGSAVDAALTDCRVRLSSSTVDIGIFGDVKRGKSTLLNALLGREVSSMRVTPETAVPVDVEHGAPSAQVIYADGEVEDFADPAAARDLASQRERRRRREANERPIERITQRVDSEWLSHGIRVVDTPGLDDPSLSEGYQELTLAELDRVAAAVLVLVVPPGLAGNEVNLVASLAERRLDKLFVVCNFHTDAWEDSDTREQVVAHVRETLSKATADTTVNVDGHVFEVHAKRGLVAALEGAEEDLAASGVTALRRTLERYLSQEVLDSLCATVDARLLEGRDLVRQHLASRRVLLSDPERLEAARARREGDVVEARRMLESAIADARRRISSTSREIAEQLTAPYTTALAALDDATSVADVDQLTRRLELQREAAASRASTRLDAGLAAVEQELRDALFASFGTHGDISTISTRDADLASRLPASLRVPPQLTGVRSDAVMSGAGVGAAGGALVGGALAGGAGIALLALGPVGWLIGAGVGLAAGALLGGGAGAAMTRGALRDDARSALRSELLEGRAATASSAEAIAAEATDVLAENVRRQQTVFLGDRLRELQQVEAIAGDRAAIASAIAEIDGLLSELDAR